MTQRPLFRWLFLTMGAWMLVQILLRFTGLVVTGLVVLLVGLVASTIYLLQYHRSPAAKVYAKWGCRQFIDLVCRWSGQQPPVDAPSGAFPATRLKTQEDFDWCAETLKQSVFGHDAPIDRAVAHLRKSVSLRRFSDGHSRLPPLGIFLFAGRRGIGKRTLATRLGECLFSAGTLTVLNMKDYAGNDLAAARLVGSKGREGDLIQPVKSSPYHTLLLENIEMTGAPAQELLQAIMLNGGCVDPSNGAPISFRHCLIIMTTTMFPESFRGTDAVDPDRLIDAISSATGCARNLLSLANETMVMHPPNELTKARVILSLMADECRRYGLSLEYVEPEIVAREVDRFSEAGGFEHTRIRISHWLRDPIHLATSHGMDSLVLTSDLVDLDRPLPTGSPVRSEILAP